MLQLRPNCEWCDRDLPPDTLDARICSFECTFCADCAGQALSGICPNCGGELLPRPRRPSAKLANNPPSRERVINPAGKAAQAYAARPQLRDATPDDFSHLLALNAASVHFLSPLTPARLSSLHQQAGYHRLVEQSGTVAGFLLAFREGADYDSPNYRWFAERYPQFLYIDRIVVADAYRGQGIGQLLYDDLFTFARAAGLPCVTCEFDVDPPNEASRRFHERYGFVEVGSQTVAAGGKKVSLQRVALTP